MFGLIRAELHRVGAALQGRGAIDAADDIFFVDTAQARSGLAGHDLRPIVQANKDTYSAELKRRHIPRILLTDGTEPEATARPGDAPEGALRGSPASAGTVTAQARVILDPVGARLDPGEILVAPSTDPGWTPLFLTAVGLVMEMGGSNSHGAVVAREYGIPPSSKSRTRPSGSRQVTLSPSTAPPAWLPQRYIPSDLAECSCAGNGATKKQDGDHLHLQPAGPLRLRPLQPHSSPDARARAR